MPAYMYPITIYRYKKIVKESFVTYFDEITSIGELKDLVCGNKFTLTGDDSCLVLTIYTERFETDGECSARIKREEKYMRNYHKEQAEYKLARKEVSDE